MATGVHVRVYVWCGYKLLQALTEPSGATHTKVLKLEMASMRAGLRLGLLVIGLTVLLSPESRKLEPVRTQAELKLVLG